VLGMRVERMDWQSTSSKFDYSPLYTLHTACKKSVQPQIFLKWICLSIDLRVFVSFTLGWVNLFKNDN